jgi:hypothetical protein
MWAFRHQRGAARAEQRRKQSRLQKCLVPYRVRLGERRSKKGDCPSIHPVEDDIWRRSLNPFSLHTLWMLRAVSWSTSQLGILI